VPIQRCIDDIQIHATISSLGNRVA